MDEIKLNCFDHLCIDAMGCLFALRVAKVIDNWLTVLIPLWVWVAVMVVLWILQGSKRMTKREQEKKEADGFDDEIEEALSRLRENLRNNDENNK